MRALVRRSGNRRERTLRGRVRVVRIREEAARLASELAVAKEHAREALAVRQLARQANEKLLLATLRAEELAEAAEQAKALAEATSVKLQEREAHMRTVAEFRERLMGEVGHDLHTPLVSITVAANVLLRDGASELQKEVLGGVLSSCSRMLEMVDQLLDLTQTRLGGGIPVRPSPGDLTAIVWAVVEEIETAHPDRWIRFEAPLSIPGQWDAGRIARVVSNLIGNALQHGRHDGAVKVGLHPEGGEAVLEVENEGPRIPPELLPTLFEAFRRGARGPAGPKGLGLGLFITHETVVAHGGSIEVESSEEGRTVFRVRLPRGCEESGRSG